MSIQKKLKLVLPKGSLWRVVKEIFADAGYNISGNERDYRPSINDSEIEIKLLRPQEIPNYLMWNQYWIWR